MTMYNHYFLMNKNYIVKVTFISRGSAQALGFPGDSKMQSELRPLI